MHTYKASLLSEVLTTGNSSYFDEPIVGFGVFLQSLNCQIKWHAVLTYFIYIHQVKNWLLQ